MSDLLEKIKAGTQNKKEITWPGIDQKIYIRILNENDHLQSSLATDKIFVGNVLSTMNVDQYSSELETQLLFRAIEDPETGKQLFTNITEFRDMLSPEIKNKLAEELDAFHEECSPNPYKLSDEEFDKLIFEVKKNAETTVGNVISIDTLRKLIIYLAKQPKK